MSELVGFDDMSESPRYRFTAECTLGRLAKWLRLAGFDTVYIRHAPNARQLLAAGRQQRILLTRTKHIFSMAPAGGAVFIIANDPFEQLCQVFQDLGIRREDLKPMTRCSLCNIRLKRFSKEDVRDKLPDYILQCHDHYQGCPNCGRLFWPGSHHHRILERINKVLC